MNKTSKSRFYISLHKNLTAKPFTSEVLVSELSADEIEYKLWCEVKPDYMRLNNTLKRRFLFGGIVQKYFFKISRKNFLIEKFSPVVLGKIEESSHGSIVFLKYFMSPNSTFLMLYLFIISSVTGLFYIQYDSIFAALIIPISMFILCYGIGLLIFNLQLIRHSHLIRKILTRNQSENS